MDGNFQCGNRIKFKIKCAKNFEQIYENIRKKKMSILNLQIIFKYLYLFMYERNIYMNMPMIDKAAKADRSL